MDIAEIARSPRENKLLQQFRLLVAADQDAAILVIETMARRSGWSADLEAKDVRGRDDG